MSYPTLVHPTVIIGAPEYVTIGKGCIICAANIITTDIQIGEFATIGAGAVVTKPIPGFCTAVGVPAGVVKEKANLE